VPHAQPTSISLIWYLIYIYIYTFLSCAHCVPNGHFLYWCHGKNWKWKGTSKNLKLIQAIQGNLNLRRDSIILIFICSYYQTFIHFNTRNIKHITGTYSS
jgi:hypothetical protein